MSTPMRAFDEHGGYLEPGAIITDMDGNTYVYVAAVEAHRKDSTGVIRVHREDWPEGVTDDVYASQHGILVLPSSGDYIAKGERVYGDYAYPAFLR